MNTDIVVDDFVAFLSNELILFGENMVEIQSEDRSKAEWTISFIRWLEWKRGFNIKITEYHNNES